MRTLKIALVVFFLSITIHAQWYPQNSGVSINLNSIFFIDANVGWAVGEHGIIIRTTDGGTTWTQQTSGRIVEFEDVWFKDVNTGIVVGGLNTILKTTDGGLTWIEKLGGGGWYFFGVSFPDPNNGWVVGQRSMIYKTTDGGETWNGNYATNDYDLYSVSFTDSNKGLIVGEDHYYGSGIILRTTNGGSWEYYYRTSGLYDVFRTDENNGRAVGRGTDKIIRTTDGGITWLGEYQNNNIYLNGIHLIDTNNGFAVGSKGTILRTTDNGATWIQQTSGTLSNLYCIFFIDLNNGWIVGEGGLILRTTNGGVTFVENEGNNISQPKDYLLEQNFPNPFNPVTSIQYELSSRQFVTLIVYDLLGKEVATLVNEDKPAGTYELEFDGTGLPSGVYFYQLKAENFIETKKMILLR